MKTSPAGIARDYHERTSHRLDGYARGPEALDWSTQPQAFRWFDGCVQVPLPLIGPYGPTASYAELFHPSEISPEPLCLRSIAALFELSLGISAWKSYMGDRWALRCNPSSGNLHPTEGYAIISSTSGIADGIYHYRADEHVLEKRAGLENPSDKPRLIVGLSSIMWREGWKYGERAFRYCQLDTGHALAAFGYAAATLGWRIRLLNQYADADIAALLGLNDAESYAAAETEIPELLIEISTQQPGGNFCAENPCTQTTCTDIPQDCFNQSLWHGHANRLDAHPYGAWPLLDEVAEHTVSMGEAVREAHEADFPGLSCFPAAIPGTIKASEIIRQRRSAQHFEPRAQLPQAFFMRMLDAMLPRPGLAPWPENMQRVRTHPVLFIHRVEGLRQGLYALPRSEHGLALMKQEMRDSFAWEKVDSDISHLPLYLLLNADCRNAARALCCHQAIGSDASFAVAMLGEFDAALDEQAANYRKLFIEAGLIGQTLYLEAENAGFRGTGIGCYFDPAVHKTLGIEGTALQSMYHFTVGMPLIDERIESLPAYAHLQGRRP